MGDKESGRDNGEILPIRIAATDIGSNALRFLAVEFVAESNIRMLDQLRVPVRLGHDVFLTGRLTDDAIEAAVAALATFSRRAHELDVTLHRSVATSAVRESRNGNVLVERARSEADMIVEPITGAEEARLVHLAVAHRVKLGKQKWLVADLGGGSVEVSIVDEKGIYRTESHEMGSVRLLEELAVAGEEPGHFRRRLEEYTATLRESRIMHGKVAGFIATGGNIESIAKLANAETDGAGVSVLSVRDLRGITERLARLPYKERVTQLGLREDRADVILPAATVYERLAVLAGVDTIIVPNVGVKDGVVLDLFEQYAWGGRRRSTQERAVIASALALGRRLHFDETHARHVAKLAGTLFDQLEAVHGLNSEDRKLLIAAALLHDIGLFIAPKRHHKHSLYIISQSELAGLTQNEIDMVANTARYHRKTPPASHHEPFMKLSDRDRDRVVRLSAILRLADSLDREHLQRVDSVSAHVEDGALELTITGRGDLLLERWALQRKAQLFEKVYDLSVTLTNASE